MSSEADRRISSIGVVHENNNSSPMNVSLNPSTLILPNSQENGSASFILNPSHNQPPNNELSGHEIANINNSDCGANTNNVALSLPVVALDRQRLQELVQQVDPNEQLEEEVEDVLLSLADDFIESLVSQACMIAKHRKSCHLDVKDVLLALDINWNMWIPGFGVDGVVGVFSANSQSTSTGGQQHNNAHNATVINRAPKKCLTTEAHKQRLALIKKVMKKF